MRPPVVAFRVARRHSADFHLARSLVAGACVPSAFVTLRFPAPQHESYPQALVLGLEREPALLSKALDERGVIGRLLLGSEPVAGQQRPTAARCASRCRRPARPSVVSSSVPLRTLSMPTAGIWPWAMRLPQSPQNQPTRRLPASEVHSKVRGSPLREREARLEHRHRRGEGAAADLLTVGAVAVVDHQRRLRDLVSQRAALAPADEWKCDHGLTSWACLPIGSRELKGEAVETRGTWVRFVHKSSSVPTSERIPRFPSHP